MALRIIENVLYKMQLGSMYSYFVLLIDTQSFG